MTAIGREPASPQFDWIYYECPRCGRRSYNPYDAVNRYCGACHLFADDLTAEDLLRGEVP